jgi:hypothetical protein
MSRPVGIIGCGERDGCVMQSWTQSRVREVTNVVISGLVPRSVNHYLRDSSCLCPQVFPMYGEGRFSATRRNAPGIDLFWVSSVRPHPLPLHPPKQVDPRCVSGGCAQARAQAHPPECGACARAKAPLTVHGKHLGHKHDESLR